MRGAEPAHVEGREAARVGEGFGGECAQGPAASLLLLACSNHIAGGRAEVRLAASCICLALPCELLSRACDVRNGVWVVRVKVGVEWCVWAPGAVRGEVRCHDGEHPTPLVRYTLGSLRIAEVAGRFSQ